MKILNVLARHISRKYSYYLFGLLLFGYLLNLGRHPLVLEEPRRAIIALEMLESGNYWVPTFAGEFYYKKPPFFNWLLLVSARINGGPSEFAFRLPTIISIFGIMLLLFLAGRLHHSPKMGLYSALLFGVSVDILFYFSLLAEIDLFYTLVTFGSILSIFHFYERKRLASLFITAYLLGAIGFLTKGLPSISFLVISIGVFFLYQKQFKLLFTPAHIAGIMVFVLLVGGYFYQYSKFNDPAPFFQTLWSESKDRTLLNEAPSYFFKHLVEFPLSTLKNLLPASILLVFAFRRDALSRIRQNDYAFFSLIVFFANFMVYWLSPDSRQRYIYPLYPLAIVVLYFFFLENPAGQKWRGKLLLVLAETLLIILAIAGIVIPLATVLKKIPLLDYPSVLILVICVLPLLGWRQSRRRPLAWIILAFIVVRICFSVIYLSIRAENPEDVRKIEVAKEINEMAGDQRIYVYEIEEEHYPITMFYYLDVMRPDLLVREKTVKPGFLYLTMKPEDTDILAIFFLKGHIYYLVKYQE